MEYTGNENEVDFSLLQKQWTEFLKVEPSGAPVEFFELMVKVERTKELRESFSELVNAIKTEDWDTEDAVDLMIERLKDADFNVIEYSKRGSDHD